MLVSVVVTAAGVIYCRRSRHAAVPQNVSITDMIFTVHKNLLNYSSMNAYNCC